MSVKRELIKGTLILTAAGFAARLLGFFNRVYLANLISNAELGRYQLIFPIFMFCMAVSCAGIQVAVSKIVAAYHGAGKKKAIRQTVKSAGITSLILLPPTFKVCGKVPILKFFPAYRNRCISAYVSLSYSLLS